MSKFGFDNKDKIDLPTPPKNKPKASPEIIQEVAEAGQSLGFVSREASSPKPAKRRGRRQTEPQDKMLVTGPKRVIEAFKDYCDEEGSPSYCAGLESLLKNK